MTVSDYLNSVLQQYGPIALPYAQNVKWTIRDHCVELQKVFPTLGINVGEFFATDGRRTFLIKSEGTIPVHYQGSKYNIPILVWVLEHYPMQPPLGYVVPTQAMVIKGGHPFVDRNGQVSTPLLRNWNPGSNLVEVVLQMAHLFGADPPLYSNPSPGRPPSSEVRPPSQPSSGGIVQPPSGYPGYGQTGPSSGGTYGNPLMQQQYSGSGANPAPTGTASIAGSHPIWGGAFQAAAAADAASHSRPMAQSQPSDPYSNQSSSGGMGGFAGAPAPYGRYDSLGLSSGGTGDAGFCRPPVPGVGKPPPPPSVSCGEIEAAFRVLSETALALQLRAAERACQEHVELEMDSLFEMQRTLSERKTQLQSAVSMLKAERQGTEGAVKDMGHKATQLQRWLEVNEVKASALSEGADLTKGVAPADDLSKQVLDSHAEDQAIEDAILVLDRALQAGKAGLTPESYLKQVRALCRQQFFARALGLKVAEAQRRAPLQPLQPGQAPPYAVGHGDTWSGVLPVAAPPPPPPPPMR